MLIEQMTSKEYQNAMLLYSGALRELNTKIEIINEEFAIRLKSNPIEHIKSRLKTPRSIAKKLIKKGLEPTLENALTHIDDIAGIRIICSFTEDIYRIATVIHAQNYMKIIKIKDYIPVFLSGKTEMTRVEIQIRTIAMDFWASLEHKIRYKFESEVPQNINEDLLECANIISSLDEKMLSLNNEIERYKI